MDVYISNEAGLDTLVAPEEIRAAVAAVLVEEGIERAVAVSVSFVDEEEIRALNAEWRGIDAPTDVLSFECDDPDDPDIPVGEPVELGDVILAPTVICAQAPEFGNAPADELRLMLVHGMLHLLGYDHMTEEDAREMEPRELAVLRALAAARGEDPDAVSLGPTTRHIDD